MKKDSEITYDSVLPAVFDSEGNELKEGDKAIMTLHGLGSGEVDVVCEGGELCIYEPTQGTYPLKYLARNNSMHVERLP